MYAASGLLSAPFSALWIVALAAVLAFHCRHIAQGCRECRWFHSTHIAMAIGMVYMFGASAFGWDLVSSSVWTALYVAIAAAIVVLIAYQLLRHGSFDFLWALALIQQGAMIYMWAPMNYWKPWVSYGLAVYFALEAIAWPLGLCSAQSLARVGAVVSGGGGSLAIAGFERRTPLVENFCMTVMAASMGYMFVGMQLLMSMPTMSTPPAMATAEPERPSIAPKEATLQQAQPLQAAPERAAADATSSYRIVAGDTLARIALRHYGDAGKWRDLVKANPGLDPRRMTVGATIALPKMGVVPASGP